jgi:DnaJ like chaperone protein
VLARVASADGPTTAEESRFIEDVAARLGLGPFVGAFASAGARGARATAPDRSTEALAVLGLERGASPEAIKQAWRKLSLDNHPDRVGHLGEEFRQLAEERMRRINGAYQTLKEAGLAA